MTACPSDLRSPIAVVPEGPLLAIERYGDADRRATGDVDVLVREGVVARARALLRRNGYRGHPPWARAGAVPRRLTHHLDLRCGDAVVELHWTLRRQAGLRLTQASLWRGARKLGHCGFGYPVPAVDVTLSTLLLGFACDLELGTARMRSLVDLATLVESLDAECDWDRFLSERKQEGIEQLTVALFALVLRVWGADAAPNLSLWLDRQVEPAVDLLTRGLEIYEPAPPAWRNKRLLFPLYGVPAPLAWAGWALSLPTRLELFEGR